MNVLSFGIGELEADFWRMVFLMTRAGAALVAAPLFGAFGVPMQARVILAGALAVLVAVWLDVAVPENLFSLAGMLAVAGEVLIGLALGFALQIAFAAPVVAAEVIGGAMGLSLAMVSDPQGGATTTAFGQYFSIVLVLIFLALGGHLEWLALVVESYRVFPPGDTWLGPERAELVAAFAGQMFGFAVLIALPVTLVLLMVQVVTGILSRSAPSLNLFALGLPAGVLAGLGALIITAPVLYAQLEDVAAMALSNAESVLAR